MGESLGWDILNRHPCSSCPPAIRTRQAVIKPRAGSRQANIHVVIQGGAKSYKNNRLPTLLPTKQFYSISLPPTRRGEDRKWDPSAAAHQRKQERNCRACFPLDSTSPTDAKRDDTDTTDAPRFPGKYFSVAVGVRSPLIPSRKPELKI